MGDISGARTLGRKGDGGWTLSEGDTLGGYEVVRPLGRGGMGEVYEVEHEGLKKRFALKLIPPDLTSRPGFVDRFRREAQVTARLEHPNIVRVDDVREDEGLFWLRMELVSGGACLPRLD